MQLEELRFDGKVALVTGAGGGMGRAYALMLASRGCAVVVNDLSPSAADIEAEIAGAGGAACLSNHDVAGQAKEMVAEAVGRFGRLDIVINNAGTTNGGPFVDIPASDFDRLVDVHLGGTVAICRAAWPELVSSGGGKIVNTSSSAIFGFPYASAYATAKAGILGFSRTLAMEGKAHRIAVNAILPSAYTPMSDKIPDESFRSFIRDHFPADAVAAFVTWLVHECCALTGEAWNIGGGRAARVVLALAHGASAAQATPEAWVGREWEVMDDARLHVPDSSLAEVAYTARMIGGETAAAAEKIHFYDWGGRSR